MQRDVNETIAMALVTAGFSFTVTADTPNLRHTRASRLDVSPGTQDRLSNLRTREGFNTKARDVNFHPGRPEYMDQMEKSGGKNTWHVWDIDGEPYVAFASGSYPDHDGEEHVYFARAGDGKTNGKNEW